MNKVTWGDDSSCVVSSCHNCSNIHQELAITWLLLYLWYYTCIWLGQLLSFCFRSQFISVSKILLYSNFIVYNTSYSIQYKYSNSTNRTSCTFECTSLWLVWISVQYNTIKCTVIYLSMLRSFHNKSKWL